MLFWLDEKQKYKYVIREHSFGFYASCMKDVAVFENLVNLLWNIGPKQVWFLSEKQDSCNGDQDWFIFSFSLNEANGPVKLHHYIDYVSFDFRFSGRMFLMDSS